jgi:hypothetical protein
LLDELRRAVEALFGDEHPEPRARLRVALGVEPAAQLHGQVAHGRRAAVFALLLLGRRRLLRARLAARERDERQKD